MFFYTSIYVSKMHSFDLPIHIAMAYTNRFANIFLDIR